MSSVETRVQAINDRLQALRFAGHGDVPGSIDGARADFDAHAANDLEFLLATLAVRDGSTTVTSVNGLSALGDGAVVRCDLGFVWELQDCGQFQVWHCTSTRAPEDGPRLPARVLDAPNLGAR